MSATLLDDSGSKKSELSARGSQASSQKGTKIVVVDLTAHNGGKKPRKVVSDGEYIVMYKGVSN